MLSKLTLSFKSIQFLPIVAMVALLSTGGLRAQSRPRILDPIEGNDFIVLKGNTHPLASSAYDQGPVEDSKAGRMLLVLKRSAEQDKDLHDFMEQQQTPGSANFHKWLTPRQFGERFGVADADIQSVGGYLSDHGFSVGRVYRNKMAIEVSGTAAQLREAFHVDLHQYSIGGHTYFANANDPSIPSALAPVVSGFAALNNIAIRPESPGARQAVPVLMDAQTHRFKPDYTNTSVTPNFYLLAPPDIQTIYNVPVSSTGVGKGGTGVTVGVIGDSQINLSLISRYQSLTGITTNTPVEIVDGDDPIIIPSSTGVDATIAYEQLELIDAVAPLASLNYYTSASTDYDTGLDFSMIRAVDDDAVSVLAIGFQACETNLQVVGNEFVNALWMQAAAEGITVVAAAGDTGPAACDAPGASTASNGLAVNGYASTPYDTAVGGTDFNYGTSGSSNYWSTTNTSSYGSAKSYIPEQTWDASVQATTDSNRGTSILYAGGGGFSTAGSVKADGVTPAPYPVPSWQTSSVPTSTARALPDLAFFAGAGTNQAWYGICAQPADCENSPGALLTASFTGGTAGSAAIFAGIMAEVVAQYGAQGNANPALYGLFSKTPSIFHDITTGNTTVTCTSGSANCTGGDIVSTSTGVAYAAGYQYDEATGLGSVNATSLLSGWAVPATKTTSTSLALTNSITGAVVTSVIHGTSLNFKASVTGSGGTPTGNVAFTTGLNMPSENGITAVPLVSGVANSTYDFYLPGGSYNVTARYAGDSTFLPSVGTYPVTVTPEPSKTYVFSSLYPSGSSVVYGTRVNVTAEAFSLQANSVNSPTGTMSVYNEGSDQASEVIPLTSEGTATFSSNLLAGNATYNLIFAYSGDPSYQPSVSSAPPNYNSPAPYTITVTQAPTTTTLTQSSSSASSTVPVTLTATVSAAAALATGVAPAGTVTFATSSPQSVSLNPGVNSSGQTIGFASLQVASTQIPSSGVIKATYNSNNNYAGSNASTTLSTSTGTYSDGNSTLNFVSNYTYIGTSSTNIVLSANATLGGGNNYIAGTVQLYANSVPLGSFSITGSNGGSYTIPTTNGYLPFPSGNVFISAVFTPSDTKAAPSSSSLTLVVGDTRTTGDFSLNTDITTETITPTTNYVYFQLQVNSIVNFAVSGSPGYAVNLACSVPTNSNLGCTLSQNQVYVGNSGTYVLPYVSVYGMPSSSGSSGALKPAPAAQHWWLVGGGSALACVVLLGIPARRRSWQGVLMVLVGGVFSIYTLSGCGSRANLSDAVSTPAAPTTNGSGTANSTTYTAGLATNKVTPGTYQVIITGTAQTNTTLVHNIPVTVIVSTTPAIANGTHTLTNAYNLRLITDPSASTTSPTNLVLNAADSTSDQQWTFTYQNNGYYLIQNVASQLYLTDPSSNTGNNAYATQQTATGDGTQLWTMYASENGYLLENASSAGVLDDQEYETQAGTPLIVFPIKNISQAINQTWYIQ